MTPVQTVIWILIFAVVTAVLYGIGLSKSMHRERDLMAVLLGKGERRIRRALRNGSAMSRGELEKLLTGTRSSLFYSRQRMAVQDPKPFADTLLKAMVDKGILKEETQNYQKMYRLQSKKG